MLLRSCPGGISRGEDCFQAAGVCVNPDQSCLVVSSTYARCGAGVSCELPTVVHSRDNVERGVS
jgi:hypothetical protein